MNRREARVEALAEEGGDHGGRVLESRVHRWVRPHQDRMSLGLSGSQTPSGETDQHRQDRGREYERPDVRLSLAAHHWIAGLPFSGHFLPLIIDRPGTAAVRQTAARTRLR